MPNVKPDLLELASRLNVGCVYDCGSRDALDGMELARRLNAKELHIFECNPAAVERCRANLENGRISAAVYFNQLAVAEREGKLDFYSIDPEATRTDFPDGNIGASSLYRANPAYPYETYVQKKIRVNATSLDAYCRTHTVPDLLWLDLQGAEVRALQGARSILPRVKIIHVEVMFRPMYLGQPLFWDVHRLLRQRFRLVKLYGVNRWLVRIKTFLDREKWFTDAVYVNREVYRAGIAKA